MSICRLRLWKMTTVTWHILARILRPSRDSTRWTSSSPTSTFPRVRSSSASRESLATRPRWPRQDPGLRRTECSRRRRRTSKSTPKVEFNYNLISLSLLSPISHSFPSSKLPSNPAEWFGGALVAPTSGKERHLQALDTFPGFKYTENAHFYVFIAQRTLSYFC